ncbi:MFS transporter [Companilactobacillus ginsenosidimutans]|uniref:MFS transporter n=1 Tax=Companilactobacillus ginsenosidimutans TaxID=1007676 RepID=A0A0H4R375_9LACO|nr:MFS transporter [Companilactobacillus ginsenosidimutans]AKP68225.1 MFS transporter [Companilactobacillus ginsenosidimutans]
MKINKKQWSWILYDWANSSYGIIVTTAVLPVYFKTIAQADHVSAASSTAYWGYANSFGTLLVSILAPFLGALADYPNFKKRLLNGFCWLGVVATLGLALVPAKHWSMLLGVYIISAIGYSASNLFYDSFLTDVADNKDMNRISTHGYAYGYLGGVISFMLFLVINLTDGFGTLDGTGIARWSFVIAAVWWFVFAIPLQKNVRQKFSVAPTTSPLAGSFKRVFETIKHIRKYKQVAWFLVAYFFYIDGVDTIFTMATSIGMDIGVKTTELMIVLLVVQLIAFPFSILFGMLADKTSTRVGIIVGIVVYFFICLYALNLKNSFDFWVLAVMVGTSQGGLQALSRSYFGKIIPKDSGSEFFGFYNILGKFSAVMGPFIVAIVTQMTGKSTIGAASLSFLFAVGLIIFAIIPRLSKNPNK